MKMAFLHSRKPFCNRLDWVLSVVTNRDYGAAAKTLVSIWLFDGYNFAPDETDSFIEGKRMTMKSSRLPGFALFCLLQLLPKGAFAQMPRLIPLPQTGELSNLADSEKFTFVLAGDNRPADKSCQQPPVP